MCIFSRAGRPGYFIFVEETWERVGIISHLKFLNFRICGVGGGVLIINH